MKPRLFTGAAGILHTVLLSVNKIIGIKNIKEVVEERDNTYDVTPNLAIIII